jgi:hypothetical protein
MEEDADDDQDDISHMESHSAHTYQYVIG